MKKSILRFVSVFLTMILLVPLGLKESTSADGSNDPIIVVSLGDSYSSGEGITHNKEAQFYGQNKPYSEKIQDENWVAHRSKLSWPALIEINTGEYDENGDPITSGPMSQYFVDVCSNDGELRSPDYEWYFVAASGATTYNYSHSQGIKKPDLYGGLKDDDSTTVVDGFGRKHSVILPPQSDVFSHIDGTVDYVTLTLGGNNVQFADIMRNGIISSGYLNFGTKLSVLGLIEEITEKDNLDRILADIYNTYLTIAKDAPNAHIIVAGYPKLLEENGKGFSISSPEAMLINTAVTFFNGKIALICTQLNAELGKERFVFVDVAHEFSGHEAYTGKKNEWINGFMLIQDEDINDSIPYSRYSYHPNETGAQVYARLVSDAINRIEAQKRQTSNSHVVTTSPPTPTPTPTPTPNSQYPTQEELFNNTYWDVLFGCTIGTQYVGQFRLDNTFTLVNWNKNIIEGNYSYSDGQLVLSSDDFNGGIRYEYVEDRSDIYLPDVGTTLSGSGGDGFYSLEKYSSMGTSEQFTYYIHPSINGDIYNEWMTKATEVVAPPEDYLTGTYTSDETTIRLIISANSNGSYHVRLEDVWSVDWSLDYDVFAERGQMTIDMGTSAGDTIWLSEYGGGIYVEISEHAEARANRKITGYYYEGAISANPTTQSTSTITDITYDGGLQVRVYRDGLLDTDAGTIAEVELLSDIVFTDSYVQSLNVGDYIDVSQYGYGSVRVAEIYTDSILLEDGAGFLNKSGLEPNVWYLAWPSDVAYTYVAGDATILFDRNSVIWDELSYTGYGIGNGPVQLNNIRDFFDTIESERGYCPESEVMFASIDRGVVKEATIVYHP